MWSRRSIEALIVVSLLAGATACSVAPRRGAQPQKAAAVAHAAAGQPVAAPPPIPAAAKEEFARALALARTGHDPAAEAQLASLARQYRQLHTPLVDLGILYRKDGDLAMAASAFRQAVARDPRSALAWTELGVTQRLGGRFQDAEQSYARAIAANPGYAPAYRDRGVLRDLYLDEPAAALDDFERYRELTGDDEPAAMWIAELRHRTGIKPSPVERSPAPTPHGGAQSAVSAGNTPGPGPQARN